MYGSGYCLPMKYIELKSNYLLWKQMLQTKKAESEKK